MQSETRQCSLEIPFLPLMHATRLTCSKEEEEALVAHQQSQLLCTKRERPIPVVYSRGEEEEVNPKVVARMAVVKKWKK